MTHRREVALLALLTGGLAFASYAALADRITAAFLAVVLVLVAATDIERRIIPNRIVLPAIVIVLAARVAFPTTSWQEFILGALGAGFFFLVPSLINSSLMGMGDVKLAVLLGAGLGRGAIGAIFVAFGASLPFALAALVRGGGAARKATLPFGPFLAFGGLVILIVPRLLGLGGG